MLGRLLDESYPRVVRTRVTLLTVARLTANSAYRFAPPFLATIARDTDQSLATLGLAISISELGGVVSPFVGRLADGWPRRRTMAAGLSGIGVSAFLIAASPNIVLFTLALLGIGMSKTFFDIALGGWIADHVNYERRGRVVGLTELSWAGGLLIGVPIMGLVASATSWRGAYVVAGVAVLVLAGLVARLLDEEHLVDDPPPHATDDPAPSAPDGSARSRPRARGALLAVVCSFALLMGAAQCAFVTFGSWLEDTFGIGTGGLAAVSFGLGLGELLASSSTVRLTDRWGKRRSVVRGTALMVPTGLLLTTVAHDHLATGLVLLWIYVVGFEFGIVSGISLASNLVPGRPSTGIGLIVGAGTMGRAATAVVATTLYEHHGAAAPFALGTAFAAGCIALILSGTRAERMHAGAG